MKKVLSMFSITMMILLLGCTQGDIGPLPFDPKEASDVFAKSEIIFIGFVSNDIVRVDQYNYLISYSNTVIISNHSNSDMEFNFFLASDGNGDDTEQLNRLYKNKWIVVVGYLRQNRLYSYESAILPSFDPEKSLTDQNEETKEKYWLYYEYAQNLSMK